MNTSISGIDLILDAPRESFRPQVLFYIVLHYWPHGVFQDAEEESKRPLAGVVKTGWHSSAEGFFVAREFFIYQDEDSAQSWEREGMTSFNSNRMLHFLIQESDVRGNLLQITIVIGALTREILQLCCALSSALRLPGSVRSELRKKKRRSRIETELREAGSQVTPAEFYELVNDVRQALYPSWTQDELACHPHDALQFCDIVRLKAEAPLPDSTIMRAMLNIRKRKHR